MVCSGSLRVQGSQAGKLDGDGKDDEVLLVNDTGTMYARDLVSDGSGGLVIDVVGNQDALGNWGNSANYSRGLGDVDGDGKDDIIIYNTATGGLYSRGFKDDGSGGLITDADSQETLSSNWCGGEGYMLLPDMGGIPEPATIGLLGFASVAMLWIRRKFMI